MTGRRKTPPPWILGLVLAAGATIVYVRWSDPFGDRGITNVVTFLLAVLAGLAVGLWLVFLSGHRRGLRLSVGLGVPALLLIAAGTLRIAGFSGSLIPRIVRRGPPPTPTPSAGPLAPREPSGGPIDLGGGEGGTASTGFPGFLGPDRNGIVEGVRLERDWSERPPERLWVQEVGPGWSAFALAGGFAVTMEQRGEQEAVTAYQAETGELRWITTRPAHFDHFLGGEGPRATPTIHGGRVYTLGARGRLLCLDGADGSTIWETDLLAEYGVSPEQEQANVQYGRANSPLVVGGLVVVPAGGDRSGRMAGLVAYDELTGQRAWESPPRQISFSSPGLGTLGGREQILIVNEDTVSGHDPATGRLLWEHPWPGVTSANASVSQAVPLAPDRVLVSKGYGGGAALLRLVPGSEGTWEVQELWASRRALRTKFCNVVVRGAHLYGLSDGILECVELESGRRVWKDGRYGHGQILLVGDLLLVLTEEGELVLIDPRPTRANDVLGRLQVLEGKTWNNLALSRDLLLVRNGHQAAAYRLPLRVE